MGQDLALSHMDDQNGLFVDHHFFFSFWQKPQALKKNPTEEGVFRAKFDSIRSVESAE